MLTIKELAINYYLPEKRIRRRANTVDGYESSINKHVIPKFGDRRLDSHSAQLDELRDCVTRLTALQEADAEWRLEAEQRIEALENLPRKRWDLIVNTALTAVVAGVAGVALATIGLN